MVDLADGTDGATKLFVKCLTALPNLHTLEIVSMWKPGVVMSFTTALVKENPRLQVQTLVLPPTAHWLLRYCPNVEDLTCCTTGPDECFVESLLVSGLNHITKFSVLYPGYGDIWRRRVHLVSPPMC